MARIAEVKRRSRADPHEPRKTRSPKGRKTSPDVDALMEEILKNLSFIPQRKVIQQIASLPHARKVIVLGIRRQLAEGTYKVEDRLDKAMDRAMEAIVGDSL